MGTRGALRSLGDFGGNALAGAPQGLRWVDAVAALDAAVGAALIVAGVYLIEPTIVDLGFYLEADRFLLAGLVLAYAGLVFTHAGLLGLSPPGEGFVSQLAGAVFGTLARLTLAVMMLTFAARASMAELPLLWTVLPGGLGLLALLSAPMAAVARSRVPAPDVDHGIAAGTGKSAPFVPASYLRRSVTFAVTVTVSVFVLGLALIAYILLDRAFIEGRPISLTVASEVIWRSLVPIVVIAGQLMIALFLIVGALNWFSERRRERNTNGFERDLSPEEVSFAGVCVQQIRDYVAGQGLAHGVREARALSIWSFAGLGLLALVLLWDVERVLTQTFGPASEGWQFYLVDGMATRGVALLLVISLAFVPNAILKLASRRAAEASGAAMLKAAGAPGELEHEIVKRVRDRSLTPDTSFDAGELMRTWGITTAVIVLVWNVLLAGGVAVWWPHERARDMRFTEAGIETGDFWTMEREAHTYNAVLAVYPTCDEDGSVGYSIALPGNVRRSLLSESRLRGRLDDLVRVDEKLRGARVPVVFALPGETPADGGVVDRMCVVDLTRGMDEAMRAKVEQVLHLDDWFERRWRQRTGSQPRISSR